MSYERNMRAVDFFIGVGIALTLAVIVISLTEVTTAFYVTGSAAILSFVTSLRLLVIRNR